MGKYLQYILLPLTLSLLLFTPIFAGSQNQILIVQNNLDSQSSKLVNINPVSPQAIQTTSSEIFADIIDILANRQQTTGSWDLLSIAEENIVYYGVAGGLAGIGLKLLEARANDASFAGTTMNSDLLLIAEQIASDLELNVLDINSTHALWELSASDSIVDLSYDFGLAGIAYFYIQLFNQTLDAQYKLNAEKILRSIQDLSNSTDGLHWQSEMNARLDSIFWYDPLDFDFYDFVPLATFWKGIH